MRERLKVLPPFRRVVDMCGPNPHKKHHICLTSKQLDYVLSALYSTANLRSKETERAYFRKLIDDMERQVLMS